MERKRAIAKIVRENLKAGWSRSFYAPDIRNKSVSKVVKIFDPAMDTNSIAAIVDMSLFRTYTQGMVFTTQGVYYKDYFEKPIYFNYLDIIEIQTWKAKKDGGTLVQGQ